MGIKEIPSAHTHYQVSCSYSGRRNGTFEYEHEYEYEHENIAIQRESEGILKKGRQLVESVDDGDARGRGKAMTVQ